MQKFSTELNINKELLLKDDAPERKPSFKKEVKIKKVNFENEFLLLIYLLQTFKDDLDSLSNDFLSFLKNSKQSEIEPLKEVLLFEDYQDSAVKETPLYAKAMMLGLNFTKEEALIEFIRVTDQIRLEYDEFFTDYLINLAKKKELTAKRKENLQNLLNLRDNNSVQEEELVQFLNTYS